MNTFMKVIGILIFVVVTTSSSCGLKESPPRIGGNLNAASGGIDFAFKKCRAKSGVPDVSLIEVLEILGDGKNFGICSIDLPSGDGLTAFSWSGAGVSAKCAAPHPGRFVLAIRDKMRGGRGSISFSVDESLHAVIQDDGCRE
ncbi:MAG: hypothetical protein SF187_18140 [Deltaproteobacteria bacterium]|nr:hypothetical protein [Deltaproteobacteria bacterium]